MPALKVAKGAIKTLGLMGAAKKLYGLSDPLNRMAYRIAHGHAGPIPPAENRIRIGSPFIGHFMRVGRNCHKSINRAIQTHRGPAGGRMLDFGCGSARVLQYFAGQGYELSACDVDDSAIDYIHQSFPEVDAKTNRFTPPLDWPTAYFDIIYSVSVWTHLPPHLQEPWLREMRRILRPGGIALLSTIGPHGYRKGTHLQAVKFTLEELLATGFQYSAYEDPNASPNTGPSYGAAYHTPDYLRREWGKVFDVVDVLDGAIDDLNDLAVLR